MRLPVCVCTGIAHIKATDASWQELKRGMVDKIDFDKLSEQDPRQKTLKWTVPGINLVKKYGV